MNEFYLIITLLLGFCSVLLSYRFGRTGLFCFIVFGMILATITAVKTTDFLGYTVNVGMVVYASLFLATDLMTEKYGQKSAKESVLYSLVALLGLIIFSYLAIVVTPVSWAQSASDSLGVVLGMSSRIALAAIVSYGVAQFLDISLYSFVRKKTGERFLWLRNNISTISSQVLDNFLFFFIAFYGVLEGWFTMAVVACGLRIVVSLLDTPFIYMANFIKPKDLEHNS